MKEKFYVIYATEVKDGNTGISTTRGYYTGTYNVNKGTYLGVDSNVDYDRVIRFKTKAAAEKQIEKLKQIQFGGERVRLDYTYEIEEVELDTIDKKVKDKIPKVYIDKAKDTLYNELISIVSKEVGELDDTEESQYQTQAFYQVAATMIKSIGR